MLSDPILFPVAVQEQLDIIRADIAGTAFGTHLSIPRVNQDANGAKYACLNGADKVSITVLRSETKENKPFATQRVVVRYDVKRVNSTTSQEVTASAYVVMALPIGPDFDLADMSDMAKTLGVFLAFGQVNSSGLALSNDDLTVNRLIAGES